MTTLYNPRAIQLQNNNTTAREQYDIHTTNSSSHPFKLESAARHYDEVIFLEQSRNFCVAIIDIIGSTKMTMKIGEPKKIRKYYGIFLNITSTIAKSFGAKIVKNGGDSLIFYFPDTSDSSNQFAFKDVLECCNTMIAARDFINSRLRTEPLLHDISYRISADYGSVEVARSTSSNSHDLFGTTINVCAKINSMARPNGLALGNDLYQIIKSFSFFNGYHFKPLGGYSFGLKHEYTVYECKDKDRATFLQRSSNLQKLFELKPGPSAVDNDTINVVASTFTTLASNPIATDHNSCKTNVKYGHIRDQEIEYNNQQIRSETKNIMLIDDEPDVLMTLKGYLAQEGFNAEAFTDAGSALKQFEDCKNHHRYHLVVLDIRMPKINGIQLFKRLKAINPEVKIVFATALEIAQEILSVLPNDIQQEKIINKPIRRDHFIQTIRSSLAEL